MSHKVRDIYHTRDYTNNRYMQRKPRNTVGREPTSTILKQQAAREYSNADQTAYRERNGAETTDAHCRTCLGPEIDRIVRTRRIQPQ